MNKAELITVIAKDTGLSESCVDRVLTSASKAIITEVAKGGEVRYAPLAKFSSTRRAARTGRNPKTGEAIQISEAMVPRITPFAGLKDAVAAASAKAAAPIQKSAKAPQK